MEKSELDIEKARSHMTIVASGLVAKLGPVDAAGTLVGAAAGILETEFGRETAADYLRQLADELEDDDSADTVRHGHA